MEATSSLTPCFRTAPICLSCPLLKLQAGHTRAHTHTSAPGVPDSACSPTTLPLPLCWHCRCRCVQPSLATRPSLPASATPSPVTPLPTAPTVGCAMQPPLLAPANLASQVLTVPSLLACVTAQQAWPTAVPLPATPLGSAAALAWLTVLVDAVTLVWPACDSVSSPPPLPQYWPSHREALVDHELLLDHVSDRVLSFIVYDLPCIVALSRPVATLEAWYMVRRCVFTAGMYCTQRADISLP